MSKEFNIIVSHDLQQRIGFENKLPWKISQEMDYFKNITLDTCSIDLKNAVIMGKNTWLSIPDKYKPLNNRYNIIVSSTLNENDNDYTYTVKTFQNALDLANTLPNLDKIFVIGGHKLYEEALIHPNLKFLYKSIISANYIGDTYFPHINNNKYFFTTETNTTIENLYDTLTNQFVNISFVKLNRHIRKEFMKDINFNIDLHEEYQYLKLLKDIVVNGHYRQTRNAKTYSLFGKHLEFDLSNGKFPLLTTKRVFMRGIFEELKWFLMGKTDSKILEEKKINIWKGNTTREFLDSVGLNSYREGDIGPMYFYQIYHYGYPYEGCDRDYSGKGYDQFAEVIHLLKTDRFSRRILMTTFNPSQLSLGCLAPCHGICINFGVQNDNELCCHMYQRSCDTFLGECYNISSYALLTILICEYINNSDDYTGPKFVPGKLNISLGDCHIYDNHIDAVKTQLEREPFEFPKIKINKKFTKFEELEFSDIEIINYNCHPVIKADMIA